MDGLAADSLVEEYLYMEDLEEDSLERASLTQILEYFALPNDDQCQAEAG